MGFKPLGFRFRRLGFSGPGDLAVWMLFVGLKEWGGSGFTDWGEQRLMVQPRQFIDSSTIKARTVVILSDSYKF